MENSTINANEYRYFSAGMYDQMVTPPGYSYACSNAMFVRFKGWTLHGNYDFNDKFYITNLQVNQILHSFVFSIFRLQFSFNHSMALDYSVHQIIVLRFSLLEYGWV